MSVAGTVAARPAEEDDLEAVLDIVRDARHDSPLGPQLIGPVTDVVDEHLRAFYAAPDTALVVAESGGEILGFAMATHMRPRVLADVAYLQLEGLYVRQGMRRGGAGRAMMHQLALRAARDGAERVVTMPLTGARSEQRFLSGLGFLPAGSRRIADTASLLRRLEARSQGKARRPRRVEELIARRRRSRGLPETPPGGVDLRRLAEEVSQRESTSMQVSRHVHTRRPDSSSRTIS